MCRRVAGIKRLRPWGLTVLFDESDEDDEEEPEVLDVPVYGR